MADGDFATVSEVRRICGIASTDISDADVGYMIADAEAAIPRFFNTVFIPTEVIQKFDGKGTNRLLLDYNPLLSVRELRIDGNVYNPDTLEVYKDSGYIFLGNSAETSTFTTKRNSVIVKYIYGTVEHSSTSSTSSTDEAAGTDVSIALDSITGFADEDWVEIMGMDGNQEVAQINAVPGAGAIVVDKLVLAHESGSKVTKLEISQNFIKLMNLVCGIACVARIIGQSYTDIVGYNLGEMHVQKGEPYTQWRETANQLIKERDMLMSRISIRPRVM